jgi:hypothetical protein
MIDITVSKLVVSILVFEVSPPRVAGGLLKDDTGV